MSPVEMRDGEVQYYSSPVMVKTQQYTCTLTSERLIIEGETDPREFKITNIVGAYPITLPNNDPGLKIVLSTPNGNKWMIWSFPVGGIFKTGDQQAWVDLINKVTEDTSFSVPVSQPAFISALHQTTVSSQYPAYSPDEMEILKTEGVRIKRMYYTLYLTNFRLILLNASGRFSREFAIVDLMDASRMESESGEPSIALTIGLQTDVRQIILMFPSPGSREAWMVQLLEKLSAYMVPQGSTIPAGGMDDDTPLFAQTLQMFTGEKTYISSPGVMVKRASFTAYLTNTRFVLMGNTNGTLAIVGEFAVNTLKRAVRITGEFGEPGICLTIASRDGNKDLHLIFPSVDLREMWIAKFGETILPERSHVLVGAASAQYSVTTVGSPVGGSAPMKFCTICGARNHPDDRFCAMCGKSLGKMGTAGVTGLMLGSSAPDMFGEDFDVLRRRKKKSKRMESSWCGDEYGKSRWWCLKERPRPPFKCERVSKRLKVDNQCRGGIVEFLVRLTNVFQYHGRESPRDVFGSFLITGVVWAFISIAMLAYVLPVLLPVMIIDFPVIGELQGNLLMTMVLFVVVLAIWIVFIVIQGVFSGIFARVFGEDLPIGEITAVVMRSTLPYAVVGWIPGFGILIAAIWSLVVTIKGLVAVFDMPNDVATGCGILGLGVVASILVMFGIV
jgi:hypothetical protein